MKTMASQVMEGEKKTELWAVAKGGTFFSGEELAGDFSITFSFPR